MFISTSIHARCSHRPHATGRYTVVTDINLVMKCWPAVRTCGQTRRGGEKNRTGQGEPTREQTLRLTLHCESGGSVQVGKALSFRGSGRFKCRRFNHFGGSGTSNDPTRTVERALFFPTACFLIGASVRTRPWWPVPLGRYWGPQRLCVCFD